MQVIDLVLQAHAEQIARGLIANQVSVQVVGLDDDMVGTLDLAANARDGQAALAKGHQMVTLLNNDRVDKHVRIIIILVTVVAVDGDELDELADLRSSQAAATVLEHHLLHLLGKRLDRRGDLLDDGALLAQTRVGRQYDSVSFHGHPFGLLHQIIGIDVNAHAHAAHRAHLFEAGVDIIRDMVPYRRLYKQMEAVTVLGSLDYTRSRTKHLGHGAPRPQKVGRGGMPTALEELRDATDVVLRVVSDRRPHQDVDQANKRRVQRVASLIKIVVGKDRTVMFSDGANDRILRQVGLDDHLAGAIAATGTARHLFQQVVGALPCAKVRQLEGKVGIDHAHERDLRKIETLCDHLGAQQHGTIGRIELLEQLFVRILAARGIGIHANNDDTLGKHLVQCVLDLLSAQTHFSQVATAAFRATARGRGIRLHAPIRTACVTLQRVRALMIRKRGGAVVAGGDAAALAAHQERRKATAVVQQHGFFAALDHTLQAFHQRF